MKKKVYLKPATLVETGIVEQFLAESVSVYLDDVNYNGNSSDMDNAMVREIFEDRVDEAW